MVFTVSKFSLPFRHSENGSGIACFCNTGFRRLFSAASHNMHNIADWQALSHGSKHRPLSGRYVNGLPGTQRSRAHTLRCSSFLHHSSSTQDPYFSLPFTVQERFELEDIRLHVSAAKQVPLWHHQAFRASKPAPSRFACANRWRILPLHSICIWPSQPFLLLCGIVHCSDQIRRKKG